GPSAAGGRRDAGAAAGAAPAHARPAGRSGLAGTATLTQERSSRTALLRLVLDERDRAAPVEADDVVGGGLRRGAVDTGFGLRLAVADDQPAIRPLDARDLDAVAGA